MSTLQELVRYCNEETHLGALMLIGEWGCGKTYIIEKELSKELSETHFIVRVSLLGVSTIEGLHNAVRNQWLLICTPFLAKMNKQRNQINKNTGIAAAINSVLKSLNPVAGNVASAVASFDPLEYIPLEPVVEDFHKGGEKKVVLVFDDLDRTKLDLIDTLGCINGYCENKGFKTIVIANEHLILEKVSNGPQNSNMASYRLIKEKTITRTLLHIPDFQDITHDIISESKDLSQEYKDFLSVNEKLILDIFITEPADKKERIGKAHNFRSLNCALEQFYRIFEVLVENQAEDMNSYLYSFITYILVSRNGIYKNGVPCFEVSQEDIKKLYTEYCPEKMPRSVRRWVEYGVWDKDKIAKDLCGAKSPE